MTYLKILCLSVGFMSSAISYSQVGINNNTPDKSAVLDLSGEANKRRGLLVPKIDSMFDKGSIENAAEGLLVYSEKEHAFMFYNKALEKWFLLNEWSSQVDGASINVMNKNVGINSSNPSATLDVVGSAKISGALSVNSVSSITATTTDISTTNLKVDGFSNNALVPKGAIIMWSGTVAPNGWGLCDGKEGRPDLRGRFIVGYIDATGTEYSAIGNTGGTPRLNITAKELPQHQHGLTYNNTDNTGADGGNFISTALITQSNNGGHTHSLQTGNGTQGSGYDKGANDGIRWFCSIDGDHDHNSYITGLTGGVYRGDNTTSQVPHENRPPYYVLAYIIKL